MITPWKQLQMTHHLQSVAVCPALYNQLGTLTELCSVCFLQSLSLPHGLGFSLLLPRAVVCSFPAGCRYILYEMGWFLFWEGKCVSSILKQVLGRTDNVTEQCGKKTQPWKAHISSRHLWDHLQKGVFSSEKTSYEAFSFHFVE